VKRPEALLVVLEAAVLGGLGLLAIFWIIPAQTSGSALGLSPGYMPTVYATALVVVVLANAVLHLTGRIATSPLVEGSIGSVAIVVIISCIGVALFEFVGAVFCGLVVLPSMMIALGERRWALIAGTTLVGLAGLALVPPI
jgi:hypothetical protein